MVFLKTYNTLVSICKQLYCLFIELAQEREEIQKEINASISKPARKLASLQPIDEDAVTGETLSAHLNLAYILVTIVNWSRYSRDESNQFVSTINLIKQFDCVYPQVFVCKNINFVPESLAKS